MEIYRVLQSIMDERNMSIPDVARASGLSDSTVRSIITRKTKTVALEVAAKLSRGLGLSLEQLNDGLSPDSSHALLPDEYKLIKKYRALDERGKSAVMTVLDHEYKTAKGEQDNLLVPGA